MKTIAKEHAGLIDIDETEPFNPNKDQALFDEIKSVLTKHGALHRFGVTLLHKHFDVYDGERMIETCDAETRTLTIQPVKRPLGPNETYVGTNWRFDTDSILVNQMCFADCLKSGTSHKEIHKKR